MVEEKSNQVALLERERDDLVSRQQDLTDMLSETQKKCSTLESSIESSGATLKAQQGMSGRLENSLAKIGLIRDLVSENEVRLTEKGAFKQVFFFVTIGCVIFSPRPLTGKHLAEPRSVIREKPIHHKSASGCSGIAKISIVRN